MAVPRSRILDLMKVRAPTQTDCDALTRPPQVQCRIFSTIFNPANERLGNKVLRQRLRGPALAAYYPRRVATFKDLKALYPDAEMYDTEEEDRLEHIQISKSRGKGAPKKKRTAAGEMRSYVDVVHGSDMLTTGQRAPARARSGNGTHERAVLRPLQCRRIEIQDSMVIWAALWRKHVYHERDCTDMAELIPQTSPIPSRLLQSNSLHLQPLGGHVGAPHRLP